MGLEGLSADIMLPPREMCDPYMTSKDGVKCMTAERQFLGPCDATDKRLNPRFKDSGMKPWCHGVERVETSRISKRTGEPLTRLRGTQIPNIEAQEFMRPAQGSNPRATNALNNFQQKLAGLDDGSGYVRYDNLTTGKVSYWRKTKRGFYVPAKRGRVAESHIKLPDDDEQKAFRSGVSAERKDAYVFVDPVRGVTRGEAE